MSYKVRNENHKGDKGVLIDVTRRITKKLRNKMRHFNTGYDWDSVVLSFPKSGRTWVAHLYVYYVIFHIFGDEAEAFINDKMGFTYTIEQNEEFFKLMKGEGRKSYIPLVRFSHHFPKKGEIPYFNLSISVPLHLYSRCVYLVRDPRDVIVSYFHHVTTKNKVPLAKDVDIREFIRSERFGIRQIVAYMNQVLNILQNSSIKNEIVCYEDLVEDTESEFTRILVAMGVGKIDKVAISSAINRASFDRMRQSERPWRKQLSVKSDDNSLRFRKGKIGSYKEELEQDDIDYLKRVISAHLSPEFSQYFN